MQNIDIKFQPSRYFLGLLAFVWFFGNIIIFFTQMYFIIKIILWIAILFYSLGILRLHGLLRNKKSVISLQLQNKQWFVNNRAVSLMGDSTITQWISILRFKCRATKKIFVSVILPDSLQSFSYRQLVMLLRTVDIFANEK